jgi:cyclopropane fatty-acyl-phospholipid synthase-like methyltransferase
MSIGVSRWSNIEADTEAQNPDVYPLKFALKVVQKGDKILEAGCGAGRILKYFHNRSFNIIGIDLCGGGN